MMRKQRIQGRSEETGPSPWNAPSMLLHSLVCPCRRSAIARRQHALLLV